MQGASVADSPKTGSREFGELLRRARERWGMSRRELAEATDLSYPYISQLETGYRQPSPAAIQKLADALHIGLDQMFGAMAMRTTAPNSEPMPAAPSGAGGGWMSNARYSAPAADDTYRGETLYDAETRSGAEIADSRNTSVEDAVDQAVGLLAALPAPERLDALAHVQARVVETVIEDGIRRGRRK
jgi:transcriptional regulator with XRE-family HTH domain